MKKADKVRQNVSIETECDCCQIYHVILKNYLPILRMVACDSGLQHKQIGNASVSCRINLMQRACVTTYALVFELNVLSAIQNICSN